MSEGMSRGDRWCLIEEDEGVHEGLGESDGVVVADSVGEEEDVTETEGLPVAVAVGDKHSCGARMAGYRIYGVKLNEKYI